MAILQSNALNLTLIACAFVEYIVVQICIFLFLF